MIVTHLKLKNWRNFKDVDVPMRDTTFILGANASGKSNFLDVFRFLRDISKPTGGGLQEALRIRGGMAKVRCLHARKDPEVEIDVCVSENALAESPRWRYALAFKIENKGARRILVSREQVWNDGKKIVDRPGPKDSQDSARLTATYLENVQENGAFRDLASFFGRVTYLHLVPQLLKFGDSIGGNRLVDDPFGQGFLERIAETSDKTRTARLRRIEKALSVAVPHFESLQFERAAGTGRPHLRARYKHFRPNAGWQHEDQFSDGTLRLIGLLWSLLDGESLLLLEEPELSLNSAIIEQIPLLIHRVQRDAKRRRQVIISTHSEAMLGNKGIDARGVLLLEPTAEGTLVRTVNEQEKRQISTGLSPAEVLLPKARPKGLQQMELL